MCLKKYEEFKVLKEINILLYLQIQVHRTRQEESRLNNLRGETHLKKTFTVLNTKHKEGNRKRESEN